jgi:transposase
MERRKFSAEFKQQVVRECLETGNISVVARRHDLRPNLVSKWVRQYRQSGGTAPTKSKGTPTHVTPEEYRQVVAEKAELASENEQLKKVLGEQTLEIAILRDLLKKANPHWRTK